MSSISVCILTGCFSQNEHKSEESRACIHPTTPAGSVAISLFRDSCNTINVSRSYPCQEPAWLSRAELWDTICLNFHSVGFRKDTNVHALYLKLVGDHVSESLVIDDAHKDVCLKLHPRRSTVHPLGAVVVITSCSSDKKQLPFTLYTQDLIATLSLCKISAPGTSLNYMYLS